MIHPGKDRISQSSRIPVVTIHTKPTDKMSTMQRRMSLSKLLGEILGICRIHRILRLIPIFTTHKASFHSKTCRVNHTIRSRIKQIKLTHNRSKVRPPTSIKGLDPTLHTIRIQCRTFHTHNLGQVRNTHSLHQTSLSTLRHHRVCHTVHR